MQNGGARHHASHHISQHCTCVKLTNTIHLHFVNTIRETARFLGEEQRRTLFIFIRATYYNFIFVPDQYNISSMSTARPAALCCSKVRRKPWSKEVERNRNVDGVLRPPGTTGSGTTQTNRVQQGWFRTDPPQQNAGGPPSEGVLEKTLHCNFPSMSCVASLIFRQRRQRLPPCPSPSPWPWETNRCTNHDASDSSASQSQSHGEDGNGLPRISRGITPTTMPATHRCKNPANRTKSAPIHIITDQELPLQVQHNTLLPR